MTTCHTFAPGQKAWLHFSRSMRDSVCVEILKHDGTWITVRPRPRPSDGPDELRVCAVTLRTSGNGRGRLSRIQDPADEPIHGRHDRATGAPLVLPEVSKPLTCAELREITDGGRFRIDVVVPVGVWELIDHDVESINDFVSETITGSSGDLASIEYRPYLPQGVEADRVGHFYLRVIADFDTIDNDQDDQVDQPATAEA